MANFAEILLNPYIFTHIISFSYDKTAAIARQVCKLWANHLPRIAFYKIPNWTYVLPSFLLFIALIHPLIHFFASYPRFSNCIVFNYYLTYFRGGYVGHEMVLQPLPPFVGDVEELSISLKYIFFNAISTIINNSFFTGHIVKGEIKRECG